MRECNTGHLAVARLRIRRWWWRVRFSVILWRRAPGVPLRTCWAFSLDNWDNTRLGVPSTPGEAVSVELSYWNAE